MQIQHYIILHDINSENPQIYHQPIDQQVIDYQFIISLIQQYYPQYQSNEIQIMIQQKSNTKSFWKIITKTFTHTFSKNSSELNIKFLLSRCIILQDLILQKKMQQTMKQYHHVSRVLNEILNQPLDINIFWSSPLYTLDRYERKKFIKYYGNKNQCFIDKATILVNEVKYITYAGKLIETIKKSKKRIKLTMDLFDRQCFKKKNYSVVYLICHTEVAKSNYCTLPAITEQESKQEEQQQQIIQKVPEDLISPPSMQKTYTKIQKRQRKLNLNKVKSSEIRYQQKPKVPVVNYFVGQSQEGQLIEIHPTQFYKMLENKNIDLLVMHTSNPYYHLDKQELDKLKIKNILLINSNPNLPDESVQYFIEHFFQKLLEIGKFNEAYENIMEQVAKKYPQVQCCCYHPHKNNCTSNDNNIQKQSKLTQKYYSGHYRYHHVRCDCQHKQINIHHCQDKIQRINKEKFCCFYKYQKNIPMNTQFFYCCCSLECEGLHNIRNKFAFYYSKEKQIDTVIKADPGIINEKQSIKWIDTILQQQRLIGNQNVIIKLLDWFIGRSNSHITQKVFNIYGGPKTGRKFIARYFANMLTHRRKDLYQEGWIQKSFESFKQIKGEDNKFVIYVQKRLFKKDQEVQDHQFPSSINCIILTYDKIKIEGIDIPSAQSEFFEALDQCPNYIKIKNNFNQEQKNKLKQYLKLTIKPSEHYYPYSFQKQEIYCILKQSIYNPSSQQFLKILKNIKKLPILELVLIALAVKFSGKSVKNELSKRINKFGQELQIQNELFCYDSFQKYFPLIFQKFYQEIKKVCFEILAIFILKTKNQDQQERIFQATTINKNSLIYQSIKKKIQLTNYLENTLLDHHYQIQKKQKISSHIELQYLFKIMNLHKAGLCFLRNCLLKHTIFMQLKYQDKNLLIKFGILFINNVIVAQKTEQIEHFLQTVPSLKEKKNSLDNSVNEQQQKNNKTSLLQKIDLVSRQGLSYLLDRMQTHIPFSHGEQDARQTLKIIIQLLKLQIYLQMKYEKQALKQTINESIQKLILQIIERLKRIDRIQSSHLDNVQFDCAVALIVLYTNGGRISLSDTAQKQIIKQLASQGNYFSSSNLKRVISTEENKNYRKGSLNQNQYTDYKGRKFFVMKLCENTAMFNRILDKVQTTFEQNGKFNQLIIANRILDCLKLQKKCEPSTHPQLCYDILEKLCRKFRQINPRFESSYLAYLYQQLQQKIQQTRKQLRLKTFIWMQINPTSCKSNPMIPMVRNTIIEDFTKYSHEKRKLLSMKMKFNLQNFRKIEQQKGCRFLCLNIDMNPNNELEFIVENSDGSIKYVYWKEIADIIKSMEVLNIFVCLKKPKLFVEELLKFKQQVLYFNFLQLKDNKNNIIRLPSYYQKMIMISIVTQITYKMHFQRMKIDEAVANVLSTIQFVNDNEEIILKNEDVSKIVIKHHYHPPQLDKIFVKKRVILSQNNYYNNQIDKIKNIQQICLGDKKIKSSKSEGKKSTLQININFSFRKLVLGLIELFKTKHGFNKFIQIDFSQIKDDKRQLLPLLPPPLRSNNSSQSHSHSRSRVSQIQQQAQMQQNMLSIIKQKQVLQFFYNTKQGFIIVSDFNKYEKTWKKWEKYQYLRLFKNPHQLADIDAQIQSKQFKINKNNQKHDLIIIIIRQNKKQNVNEMQMN